MATFRSRHRGARDGGDVFVSSCGDVMMVMMMMIGRDTVTSRRPGARNSGDVEASRCGGDDCDDDD